MIALLLLQVFALNALGPTRAEDAPAAKQFAIAVDGIRRWRADPVAFVRECIGAEPDEWQAEALTAWGNPALNRHADVACKGPGKTTTLSWRGLQFLAVYPHSKVPCTSITGDNLRDGLWAEFSKWMKRSPILSRAFEWTKTRIQSREHPETWFASARAWAKDADPQKQANTIAGLHEDHLAWLLDECSEMPEGVVQAAEAALAGGLVTKLAMAGNCTRTDGPLYRAAVLERARWHVTKITGDPENPKRSPRMNIEECRAQIAKYGRDSYVVKVNILGEFPDRQADKLLDVADVNAAMERTVHEGSVSGAPKVIGVDVARFGDDSIIFAPRQGRMMFKLREIAQPGREEPLSILVGDQLIRSIEKWGANAANVDGSGGYGGGIVDHCRARGYGHMVREILFGMRAQEHERFENRRTEMYWRLAEWVKTGGGCLPNDPMLSAELSAPIYWFDKKGRICLEPKDDIKARLGRSPDRGDSAVLTFADDFGAQADLDDGTQRRVRLPGDADDEAPTRVRLPRDGSAWGDV